MAHTTLTPHERRWLTPRFLRGPVNSIRKEIAKLFSNLLPDGGNSWSAGQLRSQLMRRILHRPPPLVAFLLAMLVLPAGIRSSASAATLSEEPFNYSSTSGPILGQNGGSGWSGAWEAGGFNATIFTNQIVAANSLNFNPLSISGNRTSTDANNAITGDERLFDAAAQVGQNDTATRYLSFLIRPEGVLNAGAENGFFGVYLDGVNDDLYVGKPGAGTLTNYVLEERGGAFQSPSAATGEPQRDQFFSGPCRFQPWTGFVQVVHQSDTGRAGAAYSLRSRKCASIWVR